ncbi:YbaN family protein [Novosphingobium sp. BL-8A]|uniref:YbaN family protein n=1 Tax=Novosphingobium sp. BL-8A TaxID=3127639 RepID=UPI0037571D7C
MPISSEATEAEHAPEISGDWLKHGRMARCAWLVLGLSLVAVGFVGIFVPLLPTTDFMLLALPCFARSSPRLEAWLLNHPRFGPSLRAWRRERAVPRHAKIAACVGMALGFGLFWLHVHPRPPVTTAIGAFMLFWAFWIIRRPEPKGEPETEPEARP